MFSCCRAKFESFFFLWDLFLKETHNFQLLCRSLLWQWTRFNSGSYNLHFIHQPRSSRLSQVHSASELKIHAKWFFNASVFIWKSFAGKLHFSNSFRSDVINKFLPLSFTHRLHFKTKKKNMMQWITSEIFSSRLLFSVLLFRANFSVLTSSVSTSCLRKFRFMFKNLFPKILLSPQMRRRSTDIIKLTTKAEGGGGEERKMYEKTFNSFAARGKVFLFRLRL